MNGTEVVTGLVQQQFLHKDSLSFDLYNNIFGFEYLLSENHNIQITVTIPHTFIEHMYELAAADQRNLMHLSGINRTNVSSTFIKSHYQNLLSSHLKDFLLKFCIFDFMYAHVHKHKICLSSWPTVITFDIEPNQDGKCVFEGFYVETMQLKEWKLFPFKMPKRKNYKDLDRQAENFVEHEIEHSKAYPEAMVNYSDWVFFKLTVVTDISYFNLVPLEAYFWLKMDDAEINTELRDLFLYKKIGDTFTTHTSELQTFFSPKHLSNYLFSISILDIDPYREVCFNNFKHFFKIKTQKDVHKKLVEVFSFRNDISQRRSIIDEALAVLTHKHQVTAPSYLIEQQKKKVLASVKKNHDYNVYKRQADFDQRIEELAHKQIRDTIIVDQIAHDEKIDITLQDIKSYLNLTKRARLRNFFCFELPTTEVDGQHMPISLQSLKQLCLREKTVNYIIYYLTKK